MAINFNLVKKPKKEDDIEINDDDDDVEEKSSSSNDDFAKKKMLRFMFIIVGVAVALLLFLYIISLMAGRTYTYADIEKIMKEAAQSYFADYPEQLPQGEGSIVEIDVNNLVYAEKMKPLTEYTGEEILCGGTVQVEKTGTEYLYTPYLNCGDAYVTIEFYQKIVSQDNIVTSGYGLYAANGSYVYRGEEVNNYVKLGKGLWRIVKVTSNNNVVLISNEGVPYGQPWDNRYNEERLYEAGINTYNASRVKEYLDKIYKNPSKDDGEDLLSKADKAKIVSFSVCTGKRTTTSESKNNSEECTQVLQDQKLGLLTLSDYLFASVDPNCKSASSKSCKNYNYLTMKEDWWLVTANKEDTSTVFAVTRNGNVNAETAANYAIVRPVIYLNSRILYSSGDGSLEKPYKVR